MGFKKHSPSPWKCEHYSKGMWGIYSDGDTWNEIAICRTYTDNKNAEMDAYLISAAPELLKACKILLDYVLEENGPNCRGAQEAIQAISKAEGRTE